MLFWNAGRVILADVDCALNTRRVILQALNLDIVAVDPAGCCTEDEIPRLLVVDLPRLAFGNRIDDKRRVVGFEVFRVTPVIVDDCSSCRRLKLFRHVTGGDLTRDLDINIRRADHVGKAVRNGNCSHLYFNLVSVDEVGDIVALDRVFDPGENLTTPFIQ
ncbi:hypothetical protein RCIP0040_00048 [Klebsiella phage RCIP0040]